MHWCYGPPEQYTLRTSASLAVSCVSLIVLLISIIYHSNKPQIPWDMLIIAVCYEFMYVFKYLLTRVIGEWFYYQPIFFVIGHGLLYLYWIIWMKWLRLIPPITQKPSSYIVFLIFVNTLINICSFYAVIPNIIGINSEHMLLILGTTDLLLFVILIRLIWIKIKGLTDVGQQNKLNSIALKSSILCGISITVTPLHFFLKGIYSSYSTDDETGDNQCNVYEIIVNWMYVAVLFINFSCIWISFPFYRPCSKNERKKHVTSDISTDTALTEGWLEFTTIIYNMQSQRYSHKNSTEQKAFV